jgi:toxin secretion/phage lysis holin
MSILLIIQAAVIAAGAFIGTFIGGIDGFMYTLIAVIIIDYITGVIRSIIERKLCSNIGARGIAKKVVLFLVVGLAHLVDVHLIQDSINALRTAVVFFYISNESISVLGNVEAIGLPIPQKLKTVLEQIKSITDEVSDNNNNNEGDSDNG